MPYGPYKKNGSYAQRSGGILPGENPPTQPTPNPLQDHINKQNQLMSHRHPGNTGVFISPGKAPPKASINSPATKSKAAEYNKNQQRFAKQQSKAKTGEREFVTGAKRKRARRKLIKSAVKRGY